MNDEFINFLNNKNCFKLILGANNQDLDSIRELVEIYSCAGCRFFDISNDKKVYKTVTDTLKASNLKAFICISIGVIDDIHFSKCKINKNLCQKCSKCKKVCIQNAIDDNFNIIKKRCIGCRKCLDICSNFAITSYKINNKWGFDFLKKADCVEFHISAKNKTEIMSKWKILTSNYNGIISICINRKNFSDVELVNILSKMLKLKKENIIIQADGNPMSGGNDDYSTTLQALACAELIKKNFSDIPIFLSGGTNSKTAKLAKIFNLDITGIGIGSRARKIIQNVKTKKEKIELAKNLIASLSRYGKDI